MKSNLSMLEHQFRQTLGKHITSLSHMMNKLAKIIDVSQTLECTGEPAAAEPEPEAKKKKSMTGKRKLKIPHRNLSGIKESAAAVLF